MNYNTWGNALKLTILQFGMVLIVAGLFEIAFGR